MNFTGCNISSSLIGVSSSRENTNNNGDMEYMEYMEYMGYIRDCVIIEVNHSPD